MAVEVEVVVAEVVAEGGAVEKEAHRQRERKKESPGGMFIPSYRLFVICILDLSKKRKVARSYAPASLDLFCAGSGE